MTDKEHTGEILWKNNYKEGRNLPAKQAFILGVKKALIQKEKDTKSVKELEELNRALQLTIKEILINQGLLK